MTTVGVLLSGCGVYDGSEIHEAVLTLLALDRTGAEVVCLAPDRDQMHVVNHATGKEMPESRNVLVEAARIARGAITDIVDVSAADLDALVIPGGFGAAKNLSDFAVSGADAVADPQAQRLLRDMHAAGKPIGAMCIAPAVVAAAFRGTGVTPTLTIGSDPGTAAKIEAMGATHVTCPIGEARIDEANRIVSTPAYMYDATVSEVAAGIESLVTEVMRLAAVSVGV